MRNLSVFILLIFFLPFLYSNASAASAKHRNCSRCHKKILSGKVAHPAFSQYLREEHGCKVCHVAPHKKKKPSLSLVASVPDLCFMCHDKGPFTKKNVHPPVAGGACTSCHDPHTSNNHALLIDAVPVLCPTCHPDRLDGKHVLSKFAIGNIHPVQGKRDPSRRGKELTCISCHMPHSSDQPSLFPPDSSDVNTVCLRCHTKVTVRP